MGRRSTGRAREMRFKEFQRVKSMRTKIVRGIIPYICPKCYEQKFYVKVGRQVVEARCSGCGFSYSLPRLGEVFEAIDYYNKICDIVRTEVR